jgi:hypothetical protein
VTGRASLAQGRLLELLRHSERAVYVVVGARGDSREEDMTEPRLEGFALWILVMLLFALTIMLELTIFEK